MKKLSDEMLSKLLSASVVGQLCSSGFHILNDDFTFACDAMDIPRCVIEWFQYESHVTVEKFSATQLLRALERIGAA